MIASAPTLRRAAGYIADRAHVPRAQFTSPGWRRGTGRHPVHEWGICLAILRSVFGASLPKLARAFGYADHTGIMYQIKRAELRMLTVPSAADFAIRTASMIERVFAPMLQSRVTRSEVDHAAE